METETLHSTDTSHHSSNTTSQGQNSTPLSNVQYFSKHDMVKLSEQNYLLWKHQILLILEGYELEGYVLGTISVPSPLIPRPDGQFVPNPSFLLYKKQDKFLASWLLYTSTLKISSMHHALYSVKKANLSVKDYLANVKTLCDSLIAAGSPISEQEQRHRSKQIWLLIPNKPLMEIQHILGQHITISRSISLVIGVMVVTCYHHFDESFSRVDSNQQVSVNCHQFQDQDGSSTRSCSRKCNSCWQPSSQPSDFNQGWYPDSGATNHITPDITTLTNVAPYAGTSHVSMGNGDLISIANVGSASLLAGSRDNAVYFEFHLFLCYVKDIKTKKTLLVGHMRDGLYRFDVSNSSLSSSGVTSQPTSMFLGAAQVFSSTDLWHKRLGHPCSNVLGIVMRDCNIPYIRKNMLNVCSTCQFGKAHRLPFKASSTVYSAPFKLVESDVWGPSHVQSNGFVYYVSFVDMYSRHTWGGEYCSLSREMAHLGIQHRVTCPHTSEQNGAVERKHRQIVDMGLTLLAQAGLIIPTNYNFSPVSVFFLALDPTTKGISVLTSMSARAVHHQSPLPVVIKGSSLVPTSSFGTCIGIGQSQSRVDSLVQQSTSSHSCLPTSETCSSSSTRQVQPSTNTHPMQTRSKSGIFKPRLFTSVLTDQEPASIIEVFQSPGWTAAAHTEKAVGCKWIFKIKRNANGSVARYKGRLVVKGYLQEAGVDFRDTFSPVVKLTTVRVVLALAVSMGWSLRQEEIYMVQPPGFEQLGDNGQQLVCRLKKALHSLKQAPQAWFHKLKEFLVATGFVTSKVDTSLLVSQSGSQLMYVLVYVDDIIVTGNNNQAIDQFVQKLDDQFSLKDLGQLNYFLGIEVQYTTTATEGQPVENASLYRSIVRALQYVVITRTDIAFTVNKVCQFMHNPLDVHFKAVKRILRYLHGTLDHGLHFTKNSKLLLEGFLDASCGSDINDRRSTSGYCVFLGGSPISWSSRKQQVVSRSTVEAEYRSLAHVITEMIWIQSLLTELGVSLRGKALVWCDGSAALAVAGNPVLHSKFKHVELDLFFVREKVAQGLFQVGHVPSQEQVADILTKPLAASFSASFEVNFECQPVEC
ncbi:hypothetical protein CXB51_035704 [Gossypium anomalum]|uniref:Integrase catalytic domain-containing protein n=1 Tax=Gossypium anomalum TaxID=47600 RepID=A0A8J6CI70_9ROSI|nr:hypothetical protein CXB51_035704 [Gossypium anomalum]